MGQANTGVLEHAISELAKRYNMDWRMFYDSKIKRVAILVSKMDHCLYDLLIRLKAGELSCHVPVIISNHANLAPIAEQFGVPFRYADSTCIQLISGTRVTCFRVGHGAQILSHMCMNKTP